MIKRITELYKCLMLTVIAVCLLSLATRPYGPVTMEQLRTKQVRADQVPVVMVRGGSVEVANTNAVPVTVENAVEVVGSVAIER